LAEERVKRPQPLTRIIETLEHVFEDEESSRTVVGRAGIEDGMIAYDARSLVNWTNIVNETVKQNKLPALIDAAIAIRPDLTDLRSALLDYQRFAARHVTTPESVIQLAEEPPPSYWERARFRILSWSVIGLFVFLVTGVLVRESSRLFFDLPGSSMVGRFDFQLLGTPFVFLGRTFLIIFRYAAQNPLGFLIVLAVVAAIVRFMVKRPLFIHRIYIPVVVTTIVIAGALLKTIWYDMPTFSFQRVLTTSSVDMTSFDVSDSLAGRAQSLWSGVVCSRVATFGGEIVREVCGTQSAAKHQQHLYGSYLMNVLLTILIATLGVSAIHKVIHPSRDKRWNLSRISKWLLAAAMGFGVLCAVLALPWSYARTVASMKYPRICTLVEDEEVCVDRICLSGSDCADYNQTDNTIETVKPEIPSGAKTQSTDVLEDSFAQQLGAPEVIPREKANRFQ